MRELTAVGKTLTLYTVPKAPEPRTLTRFSSVSFRIRSCAWLGAVPLGVRGSTSYEGKSNSLKYLKMWRWVRCLYWKQPIQLITGTRQQWGPLTIDQPTCGGISHLQKQTHNATKPGDLIQKTLTQHVIISTRNCMMELRTGNWTGVTITHPRTFANGGSIPIFYMTGTQHLLSMHHILFLSIYCLLSWFYFFLIAPP